MSVSGSDVLNITTGCTAVISSVTELGIPNIHNSKAKLSTLVSGIRSAGKSNNAALLTEQTGSSLIPLIVFDLNTEVI